MIQYINEWLEKRGRTTMLLFLNPIMFIAFISKKYYVLSFIVFMFMFFHVRNGICFIKVKMQEEDKNGKDELT